MILGQSLPPLVTGDLRGEVEISILLVSLINNSSSAVSISPRFWGSEQTVNEINEPQLHPPLSHDETSNASLAAALIEADSLAKTANTHSYQSIIYPVMADSDAMTRYFADASTLMLIIRSENTKSIIGEASILIGDSLGRGQTFLAGIAHIEEDSIIKGSLVYVLRLRTGKESCLLTERSLLESRIPSGENYLFLNAEDYLKILKRRKNEINGDGNVQISDREHSSKRQSRVNIKADVKSVLDLDITYPLATTTSHIGNKSDTFPSSALEKCSIPPHLGLKGHISPAMATSPPNFQSLSMDSKIINPSKLLHISFEVAEEVASGDIHNLLPTPLSVFQKRLTAEDRETKAKDLSGGLIGRASRGTSPESSFSTSRVPSSHNLNGISSTNSSSGIVSFVSHKNGIQRISKLVSPFAATAPRPDGEKEMIRASEKHKVLNGTDLWSAECLSTATLGHREEQGSFVSSRHVNNFYHSDDVPSTCLQSDSPSTCLKTDSGQNTSTKVTEHPSLWLAGISQPGFSRLPTEQFIDNVTTSKFSSSSLTQLLSRSSATLKGIDDALVIGANIRGAGSLHSRATFNAAETSLGAIMKDIVASKNSHSDLSISIPSKIAMNLSQSAAIVYAYQDITSSLNKGGSSASTVGNLFENKTLFNPDIMSLLEGTDEKTMAIINETASSSIGAITASDDPVEDRNMHSTQRVNEPLSTVLQEANVDYSRLKSALYAAESALRIPSLNLLGDRLRSLSQRVNGINVDVSAAILFPAATVLSVYQSSGYYGSIALLAVEDDQGNKENGKCESEKNESSQYPRIVKLESAQALQDWLKSCKISLEYSIPQSATTNTDQDNQSNNEMCNEGLGSNEVTEPVKAITVSVVAQLIGLSDHSHASNVSSSDGDNIKSGEKVMSPTKSSSPTKQSAMTSALPRKSLAPQSRFPLRLEKELFTDHISLQTSQKNMVMSSLSIDTAHLLLASIQNPSLSIPSGYVSDWDQRHSVMSLDLNAHTRENNIRFDDDGLSRWLGNVDEKGFEKGQSLLSADSSSSIVVRLYLDASSHEPSLVPLSTLSSSESARSKKKTASPLSKGETDNVSPSFASNSPASSSNSNRVLIGEGKLPLRQVLLSDSLSLDATVDIFNVNCTSQNESRASRVCSVDKTLSILKQVREKSANVAVASLGSPVRDSTDVIKSRHETFLSSLYLSSDERQRVQRALAVRTAVENNPDETKRVVDEALSPLLGGNLLKGASDSEVLRNDTKHSSLPIKSEVVARVRMRVCLLQNPLQSIEVEKNTSLIDVVETLRSFPNKSSEMKKTQSNVSEGFFSLPRPSGARSHSLLSRIHCILGANWESPRLPASSFILQSMSDRTVDVCKKFLTQYTQNTSKLATKLSQILLDDTNVDVERINAGEERGISKGGASLILSLHKVSSISPRGTFTSLGANGVADKDSHSKSSIVSLFVRAQPSRSVFSMPIDKPHIDVLSTRQSVCTPPTSIPEFRLNSDVILPLHRPSSTDDAEGLTTTLVYSNHSVCVLEVYGLIASTDESNECNVNSSSTNIKPRIRLISLEPILLGTVKVPLEGVADALTLAARSETSLWDGPERVFRYPKVFDIIHPARSDGLACGQLSLTVYAAAHGRQVLVFTGQSAAAMEIQKWWSIVVVKARKNRVEREREKREEEEMEKLKAAEDERVKTRKGKGKKVQQRVPVNTNYLMSAEEKMLTTNTKSESAGLTTSSRAEVNDKKVLNHLKFRSLELSPTQTELSSRTVTEFTFKLSSELVPPAILSNLALPNKSFELIPPTDLCKLHSSTINHTQKTISQNSNPWVIETCIGGHMNVMSSQSVIQETQAANSIVDVESALDVDELLPDFFPIDLNSFDVNHANEENVDTSTCFHTCSTEPEVGCSASNMQDNDHEKVIYVSVEEDHASVTASDDIPLHKIVISPPIAIKSSQPRTSNLIYSLDDESNLTEGQAIEKTSAIDAGTISVHTLDRDCELIDNLTLEPARLAFISEFPRLRIDSLHTALNESEKTSAVLSSSLFGSQHTPNIDMVLAKQSIDDLLAQLAHEKAEEEETVIDGKLKTNEISDSKESASLPLNSDKSSESELVNINDCASILTSIIDNVSTSTMSYCGNIDSSDDGIEHPTESRTRLNSTVSDVESQNEINFELQPFSIICKPDIHPPPDSEIRKDGILDAVNDFGLQSDAEMYSLDFESVTHAEDACEIEEKQGEDGHIKIRSDGEVDEECKNDNCMDYDNSSIENGGEVMHYDKDDDDANKIPGYVISIDEETREEVIESEEPTFGRKQLTENRSILNQSKRFSYGHNQGGRNEDDHSNIEHSDVEDDAQDNQREHSSLDIQKNYFLYRLSEHLDNVDVDEDGQEKNSDYLLSQSGSPISLLELLSYQDELFFKAVYKDDINSVNDDVIYDNISSKVSVLPVVNVKQLGVIGTGGDYVFSNLDQFPPSLTIEQCNSITFSEIQEALAEEETSRAQSNHNCFVYEDFEMEQPMIQTRQETASKLLESTFEEELISAVSVESGIALENDNSEDVSRVNSKPILISSSSSFSPSNHVSSDVAGWNNVVSVIDQWIESQRSTLIEKFEASFVNKNKRDSSISSTSAEHVEEVNESSFAIATDDTNTQLPVTLHVNDRDSNSPEQTFEHPQIGKHSHLINSDRIVQQGLLHISEIVPVAYDNHARLRQLLGLPSSSTLSSSPQHSDFISKVTTSQSQSSNRDIDVEKKRKLTRLIDVRDTNKLAELLRGIKSR